MGAPAAFPPVPDMTKRIPKQLPPPAQPPVIDGPIGPSGMPSIGNGN